MPPAKDIDTRDRYARFVTITTRWMDNDMYAHVNNVVYYSWFDTAVNQYLLETKALDLQVGEVVYLVVETGCRYFSPVSYPSVIHCGLRVAHLGTSSVRFEVGIFADDANTAAAQGHFVHVACDRASGKPVAMPDAMRRACAALQVSGAVA
jgi:acyl-CoA thioester hydrolase